MQRLTRCAEAGYALPEENRAAALERLGRLETLWENLYVRQAEISAQLAALRADGKIKTAKFRELLAEKMTNAATLDALEHTEYHR